jgi:hypothetical protein
MINYFSNQHRDNAFNLLITRVTIAIYIIWKLLSYDFHRLQDWPIFLYQNHPHGYFLIGSNFLEFIVFEVFLAIILCVFFGLGWQRKIVALLLAILLTHLTAIHYVVTNSAATFIPTIYLLVLWAVFEHTDPYQYNFWTGFSRTDTVDSKTDMVILKWFLLIIALTYFFTGYAKIINLGWAWFDPDNMAILIHREALMHLELLPPVGQILIEMPMLLFVSATSTIVLEVGFLIAILINKPLWPFLLGLLGFHTMIALSMHIFFFDQYILLTLFLPWDRWITRLSPSKITQRRLAS